MSDKENLEHLHGEPRRVLLIAVESSVRPLIATLLSTMRCVCVVVSSLQEFLQDFVGVQHESFDAVLIDVSNLEMPAEQVLVKLNDVYPSLSVRIVGFSSGATSLELIEVFERYDLRLISREPLLVQIWATLEDLFAEPRAGKLTHRKLPVAHLIFDSFCLPLPDGMRSLHQSGRQLAYQHKDKIVDVLIEPKAESSRMFLAGQVMGSGMRKLENSGLAVLLLDGLKTVAHTVTNESGEFQLEFDFLEDAGLQIRLGESSWTAIVLGKMDWAKKQLPDSA